MELGRDSDTGGQVIIFFCRNICCQCAPNRMIIVLLGLHCIPHIVADVDT
jgi:hypothetical protein